MYDDLKVWIWMNIGCIAIAVLIAWVAATQEAKVFNKFSDQKITTWDAVWADFRIIPNQVSK